MRRVVGSALVVAALALGCGLLPGGSSEGATGCALVYSEARCRAIVDKVALDANVRREDVVRVDVIPEPTPQVVDGRVILNTRSGGAPLDVIATFADGSRRTLMLGCTGIAMDPWCVDDPTLGSGPQSMLEGYGDTPAGATPVPSIDPAAAAEAEPLHVPSLSIPIDHVGDYAIDVGEATIPNGILTIASFELPDDWPDDVTILESGIHMEIHSATTGERLTNRFEHGWRPGPERVTATLVFRVDRFEPGAVLEIRNVTVE